VHAHGYVHVHLHAYIFVHKRKRERKKKREKEQWVGLLIIDYAICTTGVFILCSHDAVLPISNFIIMSAAKHYKKNNDGVLCS